MNTPGWTSPPARTWGRRGSAEIWYCPNNTAGEASPNFTSTNTNIDVQMTEWAGVATAAPLDQTGTRPRRPPSTPRPSPRARPRPQPAISSSPTSGSRRRTFTSGGGWSTLIHDAVRGYASDYQLELPVGTVSETVGLSQTTRGRTPSPPSSPPPAEAEARAPCSIPGSTTSTDTTESDTGGGHLPERRHPPGADRDSRVRQQGGLFLRRLHGGRRSYGLQQPLPVRVQLRRRFHLHLLLCALHPGPGR